MHVRLLCALSFSILGSCTDLWQRVPAMGKDKLAEPLSADLASPPANEDFFLNSTEVLAQLGMKPESAQKETQFVQDMIELGVFREPQQKRCAEEVSPSTCVFLKAYFTTFPKRSPQPKVEKVRFVAEPARMSQLQSLPLAGLLRQSLKQPYPRVRALAEVALKTPQCPCSFSLFLMRELEQHLAQADAYSFMQSLEKQALASVDPSDLRFEYIHLRVALIHVLKGNWSASLAPLQRALLAQHSAERNRVMFWLVVAHRQLGQKEQSDRVLQELTLRAPHSWFVVKLMHEQGMDAISLVRRRSPARPQPFVADDGINLWVRWIHLLMEKDRTGFATRKLSESFWANFNSQLDETVVNYMAAWYAKHRLYRYQIFYANRLIEMNPQNLSQEVLTLLFPQPYEEIIESVDNVLDPFLVLGLMRQESSFDPNARSSAGASGLMQLMPHTAHALRRGVKVSQLTDPVLNITLGTRLLRQNVERFDGGWERVLAAYNAGPLHVERWNRNFSEAKDDELWVDLIPFLETRDYVALVLRNAYWYHRLHPEISQRIRRQNRLSSAMLTRLLPPLPDKQ